MVIAQELSNSDLVNRVLNWAVAHFHDELGAVRDAPVFFLASVVMVGVVQYFALRWYFSKKIEDRDEEIRLIKARAETYQAQREVPDMRIQQALNRIDTTPGNQALIQRLKT